ncbi:putative aarF domain-containing protein kinase 2 [Brachyhypopomus gauderio]|uniref:putative aarF domain-containing protein kinase 2 n=1 Tax=Brachyhypopomus gauderio TaxID=698409 RepID=UPI004042BC26
MSALWANRVFKCVRCTIQRVSVSVRVIPRRTLVVTRSHVVSRPPKVALLCWGLGSITQASAEGGVLQRTSEKNSVAKVQIHRLVFTSRLCIRALVLLLKFSPLLLLYPVTLLFKSWTPYWLDALLWVTETSGPAFIKLGQWASTRRDIFSQEFCDRFSHLHVRVKPHPWAHTKQCLQRAFGEGWRQLFVFDSKEPVGSGCVAQVYQAKARVASVEDVAFQQLVESLEKDDLLEAWEIPGLGGAWGQWWTPEKAQMLETQGRNSAELLHSHGNHTEEECLIPVAIKVLHPGIRRQVQIDLILMKAGSVLISCLPGLKWLSLPEVVDEFEKLMTKQIDLRFEAKNIEKFKRNFKDFECVKFPTPLRPFVTRTVLVETYEESEPISTYLKSEVPEAMKQRIARMGVDTLLKMVFEDNFVHADLHPGNILVQGAQGDGPQVRTTLTDLCDTVVVSMRPTPPPLQLVLLDAGIVAQLSEVDLRNLRAVFTAVVLKQGERVAELILNHARASECQDVAGFKREMAELVNHTLSNTLSLGKVRVAELLSRVFGLLIHHKVKLESNFASIVFAIMVLEGLGRSLDPNLDLLEIAKPLLLKNCASLLS